MRYVSPYFVSSAPDPTRPDQSLRVNRIKHDIDDLSAKLAEKRAAKGSSSSSSSSSAGASAGGAAAGDETQVWIETHIKSFCSIQG